MKKKEVERHKKTYSKLCKQQTAIKAQHYSMPQQDYLIVRYLIDTPHDYLDHILEVPTQ